MTLTNFEDIKKYVNIGIGVSVLDEYTLTEEDKDKLDIYSLDRYFDKRDYGMIIRKNKYLSPHARAFIRTIKPDICF